MPTYADVHGAQFVFGFAASDAPSITNFSARAVATSDAEPEVFVTAINGEGHTEAVGISKPANKKISCSFIGYINSSFNKLTVADTFSFLGRFFFITKISDPRPKGDFVEVTIDAMSYPLVTT
jgi:hypothetical protein